MELEVEVESILTPEEFINLQSVSEATGSAKQWPVYVQLSNKKIYGADMIINATGVEPKCDIKISGDQIVSGDNH